MRSLDAARALNESHTTNGSLVLLTPLMQTYESLEPLDVVQVAILTVVVFAFLRFLSKTATGSTIGHGSSP